MAGRFWPIAVDGYNDWTSWSRCWIDWSTSLEYARLASCALNSAISSSSSIATAPLVAVTTVLLQSPKWTTETWKQWLEKIRAPFMESNF